MQIDVPVESLEELRGVFGQKDAHAQRIHRRLGVRLLSREGVVRLLGDDAARIAQTRKIVEQLISLARSGRNPSVADVERMIGDDPPGTGEDNLASGGDSGRDVTSKAGAASAGGGRDANPAPARRERESSPGPIRNDLILPRGVRPRSKGQDRYVEVLSHHDITLVVGPAGTGKTFLAAAAAVTLLKKGVYRRLILTRPAVEAGEKLGFLPGDFQAKVNPYLRPLYDALFSLLDINQVRRYLENDVIEIVPLAYMRGRTLDRAFIILDEAQNTTSKQMKMFLTRLGKESRIVVTGDITQIDLPGQEASGLVHCLEVLDGVDGIGVVWLDGRDIVRHPLVQRIVRAYDRAEAPRGGAGPRRSATS